MNVERLVLLYDELDGYAGEAGKGFFNELESVRKGADGQLVVFAAGGVGLISLDSVRGSSFFSRMKSHVLEPFTRDELVELAAPFENQRGQPLSEETIDTLRLMSGGHGLLATYALQQLWEQPSPRPSHIEDALADFRIDHERTFSHIRGPVFGLGDLPRAPGMVWTALQRSGGKLERSELERLVTQHRGRHAVTAMWVLTMLRATGLIRCDKDAYVHPRVEVEIIPSILTFDSPEEEPRVCSSLREQLVRDLSEALVHLHRSAIDFTRAIDIKARHPSFEEGEAVIEVKIWPRNDYEDIHQQVQDYWTEGVEALATVMISIVRKSSWKQDYRVACLDGKAQGITEEEPRSSAIAGHFNAVTSLDAVKHVDHFLLRLPVR